MIWAQLTSRITVTRNTAILVQGTAAQTMTVARQPVRDTALQAKVSGGTDNTGSIWVTGLVAGTTVTEELPVTAALPARASTRRFTSLAGVTTSGLANEVVPPTVEVWAVGTDGSPQHSPYTIVSDWPAALPPARPTWPNAVAAGRSEVDDREAIIPWAEHWAPRPGDTVTDELGNVWQIQGTPRLAGTWAAQFWKATLARRETT